MEQHPQTRRITLSALLPPSLTNLNLKRAWLDFRSRRCDAGRGKATGRGGCGLTG